MSQNSKVYLATAGTSNAIPTSMNGGIVLVPQAIVADSATVNTIVLPAPIAGFKIRIGFLAAGNNTTGDGWRIYSYGAATNQLGWHIAVAGALVATTVSSAATYLRRNGVAASATNGDYVEYWSDGASWYFGAISSGATTTPWTTA